MDTRSARSRGVAAVVASMALLGSGAAITGSPAQSAPSAPNCAARLPLTAVEPGMAIETLTVTKGHEPQSFDGTVIDVLQDGIAPERDMIIAEFGNQTGDPNLDTEIDEVGGIWQGMSGSPVYDANGELLGAVAYGLSWGPSTVAGITPVEYMDEYLPAGETEVPLTTARTIAARTEVTTRQASTGMKQLRVPLSFSGISQSRLRDIRSDERAKGLHSQGRAGTLVGTADAGAADAADIVDGGNLGAALSYGTITAGGVGTVTDVCGTAVTGFGHPMMFSGATSLGLMPANALYVQKESLGAPFKVANLLAPAGTITQDRLAGITGTLTSVPTGAGITSRVVYNDDDPATPERDETGESTSLAREWHADVTIMQLLSMHDLTIDAIQPGSETSGVLIEGVSDGAPFTIDVNDRFVSDYDIAIEGLWNTADLLYVLSRVDDAEITAITTDSHVTDSTATSRLGKLQQKRGGKWIPLSRRQPALVSPGGMLTVRAELKSPDGTEWLTQQVRVPGKARGEGRLGVTGGAWIWSEALYEATTLEDVQQAVADDVRNDEVETRLSFWSRRSETTRRTVSEPQDLVVEGERSVPVVVRR